MVDPIGNGLVPTYTGKPKSYRDGNYTVVTFESTGFHMCYALDSNNNVFDLCSVHRKEGKTTSVNYVLEQLNEKDVLAARKELLEYFKPESVNNDD